MKPINELGGAELDVAVARAEGYSVERANVGEGWMVTRAGKAAKVLWIHDDLDESTFAPSRDWAWGGPIIHREKIAIVGSLYGDTWDAYVSGYVTYDGIESKPLHAYVMDAPTPLIAAMRAFVASKEPK